MEIISITGASGFIGQHLVSELSKNSTLRIKVLTRQHRDQMTHFKSLPNVEIVEGDLLLPDSLTNFIVPGCTVVHLAYLKNLDKNANLQAITHLLQNCKDIKIKRFIHISTAAVIGRAPDNLVTEATACQPISQYGTTKLAIEDLILKTGVDIFDAVVLRPTAVFGKGGQSLRKLSHDLTVKNYWLNYFKSCLFNKRQMNLVHVINVAAAISFMVYRQENLNRQIFIVSEDDNINNNFHYVENFLMTQYDIKKYPLPSFSLSLKFLSFFLTILHKNETNPYRRYDSSKLMSLGFNRPIGFEDGLKNYVAL